MSRGSGGRRRASSEEDADGARRARPGTCLRLNSDCVNPVYCVFWLARPKRTENHSQSPSLMTTRPVFTAAARPAPRLVTLTLHARSAPADGARLAAIAIAHAEGDTTDQADFRIPPQPLPGALRRVHPPVGRSGAGRHRGAGRALRGRGGTVHGARGAAAADRRHRPDAPRWWTTRRSRCSTSDPARTSSIRSRSSRRRAARGPRHLDGHEDPHAAARRAAGGHGRQPAR